jgi:hypothetical protein
VFFQAGVVEFRSITFHILAPESDSFSVVVLYGTGLKDPGFCNKMAEISGENIPVTFVKSIVLLGYSLLVLHQYILANLLYCFPLFHSGKLTDYWQDICKLAVYVCW